MKYSGLKPVGLIDIADFLAVGALADLIKGRRNNVCNPVDHLLQQPL
jgi:hypothetical protein